MTQASQPLEIRNASGEGTDPLHPRISEERQNEVLLVNMFAVKAVVLKVLGLRVFGCGFRLFRLRCRNLGSGTVYG